MARRVVRKLGCAWLLRRKLVSTWAEALFKIQSGFVSFDSIKVLPHFEYPEPDIIKVISVGGNWNTSFLPEKGQASSKDKRLAAYWLMESGLVDMETAGTQLVVTGRVKFDGLIALAFTTYVRPREIWVEEC